jgi:hypothetical protein
MHSIPTFLTQVYNVYNLKKLRTFVIGQVQDGGLTLTNEVYGEIEHPVNPAFTIDDLTTTR